MHTNDSVMESSDNIIIPVVSDDNSPIDYLDRQKIIEQILALMHEVSNSKGSATFSLNGKWGSGKTFVLDMLERQLQPFCEVDKYVVFHYNCWEYDYYEEPLMAIIAVMLDFIEQETHLISSNSRDSVKAVYKTIAPALENLSVSIIQNKFGIDVSSLISMFKDGNDALEEVRKKTTELKAYDSYYSFSKAIRSARDELMKLSDEKTIVFVVDELDRCLPDYAIKVLERIHHLFYGMKNTVVLLAIDKSQLEKSVKQIFGEDTATEAYLKKFIQYQFSLDTGKISSSFMEKYRNYFLMFDESMLEMDFEYGEFISALFDGIDIRTQERLMERLTIVHKMLFPTEKKDYSFMCFELMWMVFSEYYNLRDSMPIKWNSNNLGLNLSVSTAFSKYVEDKWAHIGDLFKNEDSIIEPTILYSYQLRPPVNIPHLMVWYLSQMYDNSRIKYVIRDDRTKFSIYKKNIEDLKTVDNMLQIIK